MRWPKGKKGGNEKDVGIYIGFDSSWYLGTRDFGGCGFPFV